MNNDIFLDSENFSPELERLETFQAIGRIKDSVKKAERETDDKINNKAAELGQQLSETASRIEADLESKADEINANVGSVTSSLGNRITGMGARIDNIIAGTAATQGNSELVDIRTAANGIVYQSAGSAVRGQVDKLTDEIDRIDSFTGIMWEDGFISAAGVEGVDPNRKRSGYIPCTGNITVTYMAETNHENISALTVYDVNLRIIDSVSDVGEINTEYTYVTPANTRYIRVSSKKSYQTSVSFSESPVIAAINNNTRDISTISQSAAADSSLISSLQNNIEALRGSVYVDVNGSDSNTGRSGSPFATVDRALRSGAWQVIINEGIYEQSINLQNAVQKHLRLINGSPTGRVIFRSPDSLVAASEEKADGCTKVYYSHVTAAFAADNKWIYQEGVPDSTTLITDEERHPCQRGYAYRCEDTRIIRCTASTVTEALQEIDGAEEYKWFYDAENSLLYFSRPASLSAQRPLRASFGGSLFYGGNRNISLELSGIETKYIIFNISGTSNSKVVDCRASNVFGSGAFNYSRCIGAEFIRCEASFCCTGTNGDGFNAHSNNTGEPFSKQTTVTLTDCWAHDNRDDGYSDHERSEAVLYGGLYEYNGKSGITPSYGSHCSCYNVLSRYNKNGFYYLGVVASAEGGKYGQLSCTSCTAMGNTASGYRIDGAGNSAILTLCRSVSNQFGYYSDTANNGVELIDCGAAGNQTAKAGNIRVTNTSLVV